MKKILIITSAYGSGHKVPAEALQEELLHRGYAVSVLDFKDIIGTDPERISKKIYELSAEHLPLLYQGIASITDSEKILNRISSLLPPSSLKKFEQLLQKTKPDIIVTTYPAANRLITMYKKKMGFSLVTVVTDLKSLHRYWIAPGTDAYLVPLRETKIALRALGVPARLIHVLGFPLRPVFTKKKDNRVLRQNFSISTRAFVVLYMLHTGPDHFALPLARKIEMMPNTQLVVICGKNEKLRTQLVRKLPHAHVLGFVSNIDEYLRIANVAMGKAGTGFLMESATMGCPVIITKYLKPQEEGNAQLFEEKGIGFIETSTTKILKRLEEMEKTGEKKEVSKTKTPLIHNLNATRRIVNYITSL
ncbi:MAG: glycosyltransferase [Candidatus Paceibacterota bacterium]|jgi:processive 1,2-diacylglycerol beta-glucosyltransferase